MTLYKVTVSLDLVVLADSPEDAVEIACDSAEEESRTNGGFEIDSVSQILKEAALPVEWKTALPYGGDGDKTCEEYLDARKRKK